MISLQPALLSAYKDQEAEGFSTSAPCSPGSMGPRRGQACLIGDQMFSGSLDPGLALSPGPGLGLRSASENDLGKSVRGGWRSGGLRAGF